MYCALPLHGHHHIGRAGEVHAHETETDSDSGADSHHHSTGDTGDGSHTVEGQHDADGEGHAKEIEIHGDSGPSAHRHSTGRRANESHAGEGHHDAAEAGDVATHSGSEGAAGGNASESRASDSHESDSHGSASESHPNVRGSAGVPERSLPSQSSNVHADSTNHSNSTIREELSEEECSVLSARWHEFRLHGLEKEIEAEEVETSPAFFFLMAVGQAGSVELCFTAVGVILKVLFLTQHPKSEEIVQLERYHVDASTGSNVVVAVGLPRVRAKQNWKKVNGVVQMMRLRTASQQSRSSAPEAAFE